MRAGGVKGVTGNGAEMQAGRSATANGRASFAQGEECEDGSAWVERDVGMPY